MDDRRGPLLVQVPVEYDGSCPAQIDAHISENEQAAAEAVKASRARQRLLA